MDIDTLIRFLGWSFALNFAVLLLWFFAFVLARPLVHRLQGQLLGVPHATIDTINLAGMVGYKLAIMFFNLAPLLVLLLMR